MIMTPEQLIEYENKMRDALGAWHNPVALGVKMTPEQLALSGSENAEQTALFCWAGLNQIKYPPLKWMFAVPNGGFRFKREAGRLKAGGVKAGVPDVVLPH